MHETNAEHQKLHDAQERRIQLEAQALREAHQYEEQAEQSAHEYQQMIHELRRQADEQPDARKLLWKQQLFQQASYKAEIHELSSVDCVTLGCVKYFLLHGDFIDVMRHDELLHHIPHYELGCAISMSHA